MVALTVDARQMRKLERAVRNIKDGVPKVLAPAINRALEKGRTTVRREIRKEYLIKQKDIPVAVQRANRGTLSGAVVIEQGMLPLSKFQVTPIGVQKRKNKQTLFARVKKGGGGSLPGAFNVLTSNYLGPYIREGGAGRLPIRKLMTIGASIMASQPSVGPNVNKEMGDTLAKRIDHEIKRVLASAGGHT
jgi:Prophage minor tail protein Z (GPZ)